jgi:hypothetical protein
VPQNLMGLLESGSECPTLCLTILAQQSRMRIPKYSIAVLLGLVPMVAHAAPPTNSNDWKQCAAIDDGAARLACYDAANPPLHPAKSVVAPPENTANQGDQRPWYDPSRIFGTSPEQQTRPEQFGAESLKPPENDGSSSAPPSPEPIESISAGITDYTFDAYGHFVVFLNNGQVWKQSQNDNSHPHFHKDRPNSAVISRGLLGGYGLVLNDGVASYTVRRVK